MAQLPLSCNSWQRVLATNDGYHRHGRIVVYNNTNHQPDDEVMLGDFPGGLKDVATENPEVRRAMIQAYARWVELLDLDGLTAALRGADFVFHLAANADVRHGLEHPRRDLDQNTVATFHVLEAMRAAGVREIAFSSTGSIYGDAMVIPTPEDAPFPVQTSLYGASKLAAEGLIAAYAEGFGIQAHIFRFVSILGERYTHGHVVDFYRQLREHPERLDVLGDGNQRKSYLYVGDCIGAILAAIAQPRGRVSVFNLGTDAWCTVKDSIGWICGHLGLHPRICFSGGDRGWVGDSPFIFLDTRRIRALGWQPHLTIQEGIVRTLAYLQRESWVLERRS
jgi:UDP-glucose 4-epimerase